MKGPESAGDWAAVVQAACAVLAVVGWVFPWTWRQLRPSVRDRTHSFMKLTKEYPRPKAKMLKQIEKMRAEAYMDPDALTYLRRFVTEFPDVEDGQPFDAEEPFRARGDRAQTHFRQVALKELEDFLSYNKF